jgi:predicted LPLAT superfamily acyltransferase
MSAVWLEQRERGTALAIKTAARLVLGLGHAFGRLLLYPICAYFLAFSRRARTASREYLGRVLGRPATLGDIARHYLTFAKTLQDRVYFLAGRTGEFTVEQHGAEIVERVLAKGKGCVLLGAHLGSFEVLRVIGSLERKLPVNVLLYPDNAANVGALTAELCPGLQDRVIPLGRPETLLRVRECLERGEIVGILGDRALKSDKMVRCDFLGAPASFPQGPLLLAAILKAPVVLFFGLYLGGRRYAIHFESFTHELAVGRRDRSAQLRPLIARYAGRVEHYCRLAPYNWFNFYDFWRA